MRFPVRRVEKPWGFELIFAHTSRYVGKVLHVEAGHALSLQYHERKDETIFVSAGSVSFEIEENGKMTEIVLKEGDSYHVTPGTKHRMTAGQDGCDLFEVSTPELDDVIRLEDRYGRT